MRDTTRHPYTFDLTNERHFRAFKHHEDSLKLDRPLTAPGIYTVYVSKWRFERAIKNGFIGWPAGERPDSLAAPDSSRHDSSSLNGAGESRDDPLAVYLRDLVVDGEITSDTVLPVGMRNNSETA